MALENEYIINVDIKKQFTSRHIAFRRGDNGVIVFRLFDDGEEYNINTATKAVLHQSTPSGMKLATDCEFTSINGKRVIRYEYEEVAMVELGYNTLVLVIYDGDTAVSIQPFSVTIYDDLEDGADSYLELIQDLMKIIDDLTIDLNNTIKLSEKGVSNGVATLDKDGKIPLSQMPNSFQSYIDHITETVYLNKVHGMSITTDGIMQYVTPNGIQNVGFAPDATGGGGSGGQVLSATVKVDNGIATVTYSGAPSVNSQKWATGDRNKAYFATNGNAFNGLTFPVVQLGSHTLWYKDSNGNEYVVLFIVTSEQLAPIEVNITVEDGIVSVDIGESVQIKKWDTGTRTVEYFQYNGNVFAGNAFTVTDVGIYTVYYKTISGVESVYTFEVTEEMLPSVEMLVSDLKVNDVITLYGDEYLVIGSTATSKKVTLRKSIKTFKSFNVASQISSTYASYSPGSLAEYMNTTYLDSLSRNLKYAITKGKFAVDSNYSVTERVGLLQIDEYISFINALDTSLVGDKPLMSLSYGNLNNLAGYVKSNSTWGVVNVANTDSDVYINPTFALRNEAVIDGEVLILPELPPINVIFNPNANDDIRYQHIVEPSVTNSANVYSVKSGWSTSKSTEPLIESYRYLYNGSWSDVINQPANAGIDATTSIVNIYDHVTITDINGKETKSVSGAFAYGYTQIGTFSLDDMNVGDAFMISGVEGHYLVMEKNVNGGVQVIHFSNTVNREWTEGLEPQPLGYVYDKFLPTKNGNIGHYLNNTYYNNLPGTVRASMISRSWGTSNVTDSIREGFVMSRANLRALENTTVVNAKVGIPNYSDLYYAESIGSLKNYSSAVAAIPAMNQILQDGSIAGMQMAFSKSNVSGQLVHYLGGAYIYEDLRYYPSYVLDKNLYVGKISSY